MSRFLSILGKENIDPENPKEGPSRGLKTNFGAILGAIFSDILEKKSSVYRDMIAKGINIDLSQGFQFPDKIVGSMPELVEFYNEDMK